MTIAQDVDFGLSPIASSPENMSSLTFDDDLKEIDNFDEHLGLSKPKKSTGRKGAGGADKRATHNAIERARRESLNGRFMTLAEALPSMANVKRPSKSVIVNKALDFVFEAQVKEHALIKENNDLRLQVDQLRNRLGMGPLPPPEPLTSAVNITHSKSRSRSFEHFSRSLSSADVTFDDKSIRHEMGESPSSELHSPSSIYSPQMTIPSPPHEASPTLSYPPTVMFQTLDMASTSPIDSSHDAHRTIPTSTPSPFLPHVAGASHLIPMASQGGMMPQYGYLNPSMLAQQHSILIAAYSQQQQMQQHQAQQVHHQLHQQQQQQMHLQSMPMQGAHEMYGIGQPGPGWSVFGGPGGAGGAGEYAFLS